MFQPLYQPFLALGPPVMFNRQQSVGNSDPNTLVEDYQRVCSHYSLVQTHRTASGNNQE